MEAGCRPWVFVPFVAEIPFLGYPLPKLGAAIGGGRRFVPESVEEFSNLFPVIPRSSCPIRLRAPRFVVKLIFVGALANSLAPITNPAPLPRLGIADSALTIRSNKFMAGKVSATNE